MLNCSLEVNEFELQSRCYIYFRTNTLEKVWNLHQNPLTKVDMPFNKERKKFYGGISNVTFD